MLMTFVKGTVSTAMTTIYGVRTDFSPSQVSGPTNNLFVYYNLPSGRPATPKSSGASPSELPNGTLLSPTVGCFQGKVRSGDSAAKTGTLGDAAMRGCPDIETRAAADPFPNPSGFPKCPFF